jgi:hypothetical protein
VGARFQREEVMPGAGELEPFTGSPFWGSEGEQEGQKEVLDGGETEFSGAGYSGRGRAGRRCSSGLGESRGGAASVQGRAGAAASREGAAARQNEGRAVVWLWKIRMQASTGGMETWREQSDIGATAPPRARGAQPGPARSADPEAPAEERLHGGVLQRADDEARAQLQKGGGGGCRGRCARGRERAWAAQHEMEVAQAPAEGIEARWPEMAGAAWNLLGLA